MRVADQTEHLPVGHIGHDRRADRGREGLCLAMRRQTLAPNERRAKTSDEPREQWVFRKGLLRAAKRRINTIPPGSLAENNRFRAAWSN